MTEKNIEVEPLPWTGERYLPDVHGIIQLEHLHRYLLASRLALGKRVLDIACGEGYGSNLMAQSALSVIGVDIATDAVAHASAKYRSANLEFRIGSCAAIPLPDHSVDIVVSFETIEHHHEHDAMMREIKRVLVPGGVLIMSSPDKLEYSDKPGYSNEYHVRELYRSEFKSLLEAYFKRHHMSGQRVVYGSAIFNEDGVGKVSSFDINDKLLLPAPGIPHALYLIAVASDDELPLPESGILEQLVNESREVQEALRQIHVLTQTVLERDSQIAHLNYALAERDERIAHVQQKAGEIDVHFADLRRAAAEHDKQVAALKLALSERGDDQLGRLVDTYFKEPLV